MVKLAGAFLVMTAGTLIGFAQAARYAARPRQIRELLHALKRLETEIAYGQTPLPEALGRIGAAVAVPLRDIFVRAASLLRDERGTTAEACWREAVETGWPDTALREAEKEAMLRLGTSLGASDRADQLKHVRLAMAQLEAEEAAAREEQRKYEKMCRSLGMLGAALVVILMV
jgi:stage III sporulation protein AB